MKNPKPGQEPSGEGTATYGGDPHSPYGDLQGVVEAMEDAANAVGGALSDVARWLGTVMGEVGDFLEGVAVPPLLRAVLELLADLLGPDIRPLSVAEQGLGSSIFRNTLPPYAKIAITDIPGLEGRPWTIPGWLLLPISQGIMPFAAPLGVTLVAAALAHRELADGYLLNFGSHYGDAGTYVPAGGSARPKRPGQKLIHELAHVWQGQNDPLLASYVVDSIINQIKDGHKAYEYTPGKKWDDYNAEQQAKIVEDYYVYSPYLTEYNLAYFAAAYHPPGKKAGFAALTAAPIAAPALPPLTPEAKAGQALYRYMKDNIWAKNPNA